MTEAIPPRFARYSLCQFLRALNSYTDWKKKTLLRGNWAKPLGLIIEELGLRQTASGRGMVHFWILSKFFTNLVSSSWATNTVARANQSSDPCASVKPSNSNSTMCRFAFCGSSQIGLIPDLNRFKNSIYLRSTI